MFEAFGLVFGGLLRFAPEILKYLNGKQDRAHEQVMLTLQIQADTARAQLAIQSAEKQGLIAERTTELQALVEAVKAEGTKVFTATGNKWTDRILAFAEMLSAPVRAILTYWYCIAIYGSYKVASFALLMKGNAAWDKAITALYTPQDGAIMMSIISFWFVDRSLRKSPAN